MKSVQGVTITIMGVPVTFGSAPPKPKQKPKKIAAPLSLDEINAKLVETADKPFLDTIKEVSNTILAFVLYVTKRTGHIRLYGVQEIVGNRVRLKMLDDNGGENAIPSLSFRSDKKSFSVEIASLYADLAEVSKKDNVPLCDVVAKYRYLAKQTLKIQEPEKVEKRYRRVVHQR